ncbi:MAG: hypothetical protein JJU29_00540 [Verrucomicrobia bacterium]|nr:hypothetical protein [Verrucomicrobiota bacterium]MCH8510402.1 hypothetical protein [Kiritimatiellia bacterium]
MNLTLYEKLMVLIATWTFVEGTLVILTPGLCQKISARLFPKFGKMVADMSPNEFRRLGAVELLFGLLLGAYLYFSLG